MGVLIEQNWCKELHIQQLYDKYKLLGMNIFKWSNLPNGIESRHIEQALFDFGQAIFYEKPGHGIICLPCTDGLGLNVYGDSTQVTATGYNVSEHVNVLTEQILKLPLPSEGLKGIRIQNNDLMKATHLYVLDYAYKMYEVENAININIKQQKFPYIVLGDTNNELSVKTFVKEMEEGQFAIIKNKKTFDPDSLKVANLDVPYVADRLNQYKYELEREILTFFGLNNSYEKKERMLVDEVNSNNDYISRNVELMFKCREYARDMINDYFGLDITVEKVDLFHTDRGTLEGELFDEME